MPQTLNSLSFHPLRSRFILNLMSKEIWPKHAKMTLMISHLIDKVLATVGPPLVLM